MKSSISLGIFIAAISVSLVQADKPYLEEKPSFLKPCKQADPDFNKCFATDFQVFLSEWKDGIPGLTNIGSLDPINIEHIAIVEDNNNAVAKLDVNLYKTKLSGISQMKVVEASFNPHKVVLKIKMFGHKLNIDSQYSLMGRILSLPLSGNGRCTMSIDDVELSLNMRLKTRKEYGHLFTDIDKVRLEITKVGGFHIHLENLFNGNNELTEGTNAIINQNWQTFYEALGPAITKGIEVTLADFFTKAYAYVPANYFIADLMEP